MTKPLCIYHGNCADGFGAAWVVRKALGDIAFFPGFYGQEPPDVTDRDVIMVDFSYKRPVLERMAESARVILILDHHKTAAEDLAGYRRPIWGAQDMQSGIWAEFDMNRSGAGMAWDFFFPGKPRPRLIDHIEDRDLWRFALPGSADMHVAVMSYPLDFSWWDAWGDKDVHGLDGLRTEGMAINRKLKQDVAHVLGVATRQMKIGGIEVPVVNLPYMMASEAAGELAESAPFAGTYYDGKDARHFSLRSRGEGGADVSAIAKSYGGGGHKNAAGFQVPIGWEGSPRIKTEHVYPPIPVRSCDWAAWYDGYEEGGPTGSGATEAEAIRDLIENHDAP
jgi:hypothetical protein